MEHKGYIGSINEIEDDGTLYGRVVNIRRDHVDFLGKTGSQVRKAFVDSVEAYLEVCRERGEEPEKPFSGKFVVRLDPGLHRRLFLLSQADGLSINSVVVRAVKRELATGRD